MPSASLNPFRAAAASHVGQALGLDPASLPVTNPPDATLGDYAVGLFPAAKAKKGAPPVLAKQLAAAFTPTPLLSAATASGPYLNFTAARGPLLAHVLTGAARVPTTPGAGKTVVIDFSSPNIAKQLAYHHIRSTMIGWALCNLHRALGYRVIGINHLGDWGTTHGMLLAAAERSGTPEPLTIESLNAMYVGFRREIEQDPSLEDAGRAWFKRLEDGDPVARALWNRFREVSITEFREIYDQLQVSFDLYKGESEFEAAMPGVIKLLGDKGLTSISEGALVVNLDAEGMPPCLLRKADGATLYATRDLAAAIDRYESYHFDRCLYVVDKGQGLHFKQLFAVLAKAGFAWSSGMAHVDFGQVRIGGKKAATRGGNVVFLKDVLAEATERSLTLMKEIGADVPPEAERATAATIGIGAVLFANVKASRIKDIDFEWEEVISIKGSAAPYIQYTHARIASILRNAGSEVDPQADTSALELPEELALAKALADFPDVVQRAADECEPHGVGGYLLELCSLYSNYYSLGNADPSRKVLVADRRLRAARLALSAAAREVLAEGLRLLGIGAPDRM